MSLEKIRYILENLDSKDEWSINLLRIIVNNDASPVYASRRIVLYPEGTLIQFIKAIKDNYLKGSNSRFKQYSGVLPYEGAFSSTTIYTMSTDNSLIADEYKGFQKCLIESQTDGNPFDFQTTAYAISGIIHLPAEYCDPFDGEGHDYSVKMITMQNPFSVLKHKFLYDDEVFREIKSRVLSIRPYFDVLIVGDTVYMLTMAGEKLFNMERTYKAVCKDRVFEMEQAKIISDPLSFSRVAQKGQNPRKFVAFRQDYFLRLVNYIEERHRIAGFYGIRMDGDVFDTSTDEASNKLIKFICGKGMRDAFEDIAVEVDGARPWK